jgi:galactokinase
MADRVTAFAPGRINVIGEHTDYNDGLSLPFAIEQGVTVTATAIDGDEVEAVARDAGERDVFALKDPPRADGWRAFVRGMVAELRPPRAVRLEIAGDVPQGAGLSSSAALEVALALALLGVAPDDRIQLAQRCSKVENEWTGARTGLLDQLASLYGAEGAALRIDFRAQTVEEVAFDLGGWRLVSVDSGEPHGSGYNDRRAECAEALERLGLDSMRDATIDGARGLPEPLNDRVGHVIGENARVDAAVAALAASDLDELGRLLDASHESLRDLYAASTPAVERTVDELKSKGAAGARMVGGGFGGHVLALFPPHTEPPPDALEVKPSKGARIL